VILKQFFSYGCNIQSVGLNDGDAVVTELVEDSVAADCVAVAMVEVGIMILELVAMAEDNAVYIEEFSDDVADAAVGKKELDIASDFAKSATKSKEVRHKYLQTRSFYSIVFSANRKSLTSIQYLLRKSIAMTAFVRPSSNGRSYHVIEL
jgi:hypothetical protein